jgi:DNA-binding beta-propeller fold protein YncE
MSFIYRRQNRKPQRPTDCFAKFWLCLGAAVLLTATARATDATGYQLQEPIFLADTGGRFDYLQIDADLNRLLLNHTGNGSLDVFDLQKKALTKVIPTGAPHGVAVDVTGNRYFVTAGDRQRLVIVDRGTLEITGEIELPGAPDSIAFNPKNGLVYVSEDNGLSVWVIDPNHKTIAATITVPKAPEYILYDPVTDKVFQNIKSEPKTAVIDPVTNQVVASWSTLPAENGHGLALDGHAHLLFSAGGNGKLVALDTESGKLVSAVAIVPRVDQIAYDEQTHRLFCPSGQAGQLTVVNSSKDKLEVIANLTVSSGVHSLAVDPKTHSIWIASTKDLKPFVQEIRPN